MDRNCEVCKHHTEKGCCKWECQFEPKLSERDLHFRYLDGCADGLNEARKDTIRELENIWEKIRALPDINPDYPMDRQIHISRYEVQNIIYERLSELKGKQNETNN